MPTNSEYIQQLSGIEETGARAAFEVLCCDHLADAVFVFLHQLLQQEKEAASAFLCLAAGDNGTTRFWGIDEKGSFADDVHYHVNHRAMKRALEKETVFAVEGINSADSPSYGPELYLSCAMRGKWNVAVSLRRTLQGNPYHDDEKKQIALFFRGMARALERIVLHGDGDSGVQVSEEAISEKQNFSGLTCHSEAMQLLLATLDKITGSDFNVCIFGESGSGKDAVARYIHAESSRSGGKFIAEACGAVNEDLIESELFGHKKGSFTGADEDRDGLFVLADGGTLYLDEIADMPMAMQSKLLRVLQNGEVRPVGATTTLTTDVRIISSTNRNIEECIDGNTFRADLYWRLNVIAVKVPPLRDRREDLPFLIEDIETRLRKEGMKVYPLSKSARGELERYHWPGNVRQLQTVLRRVNLVCGSREITRKAILKEINTRGITPWKGAGVERDQRGTVITVPSKGSFKELLGECEKAILSNALREYNYNKSRVTRALKIPRQSLYNKMEKYDLFRREEE